MCHFPRECQKKRANLIEPYKVTGVKPQLCQSSAASVKGTYWILAKAIDVSMSLNETNLKSFWLSTNLQHTKVQVMKLTLVFYLRGRNSFYASPSGSYLMVSLFNEE